MGLSWPLCSQPDGAAGHRPSNDAAVRLGRQNHRSVLLHSSRRISSELSGCESDPVCRGCDQPERSGSRCLVCLIGRSYGDMRYYDREHTDGEVAVMRAGGEVITDTQVENCAVVSTRRPTPASSLTATLTFDFYTPRPLHADRLPWTVFVYRFWCSVDSQSRFLFRTRTDTQTDRQTK